MKQGRIDGPTLIVAKIRNNKVATYGNLDKIWMNVADKNAFVRYVQVNVAAFSK